jgi:Kef-type K+ transport system membrane component KefB
MSKSKNVIFYVGVIGAFLMLIYWIVSMGVNLEVGRAIKAPDGSVNHWNDFVVSLLHTLKEPLAILLVQIITIIIAARIFGWLCKKIGQPTVVGEILAGIVLGPSLIGMYFPEFSATVFPVTSFGNLKILAEFGLIIFMFVVGMEIDFNVLRNQAKDAVVISHASIIIPFTLGMGLAYFIYESFAPDGIQFFSFALFMGISLSITAFPVLARIVQEKGIQKTRLGKTVITCAAADDITAWCILAMVIAVVKAGSFVSSLYTIGLAVTYVFVMLTMVRPFLRRVGDLHTSRENMSRPIVAIFFIMLIISAYVAEVIGIHALFGAFMAGAIMPENVKFRNIFIDKVEDVALVLLLPLFFVFTGLRTQIGLLNDASLWALTGVIILLGVAGKFLGSAIAAKFVGQTWKDSLTIGALMNTRGLMELVVLNIGYDLGVLTPQVFAMMVIMALVTTFMTSPLLDLIKWLFKSQPDERLQEIKSISKYRILLSFANPESGRTLLRLANSLTKKLNGNASLTAMHLTPASELNRYNENEYEKESFAPIVEESHELNQAVTTLFKSSNDIEGDITEVANTGNYDLLLIGLGQSIFDGSVFGKILGFTTSIINPGKIISTVTGKDKLFDSSLFDERTKLILSKATTPVGILIDKGFTRTDRVYMPIVDNDDSFMITYAQKLIHNNESQITVGDMHGAIKRSSELKERLRSIEQSAPNHIVVRGEPEINEGMLSKQDLMVVSIESWKKLVEGKHVWLKDIPSVLIVSEP